MTKITTAFIVSFSLLLMVNCGKRINNSSKEKRSEYLEQLLNTYRSDKDDNPHEVPIWENWLRKTGELPPDFDKMRTCAAPPDLMVFENGKPVKTPEQWQERKQEIVKEMKEYMFGNWPPPPPKTAIKYQEGVAEENELYTKHNVQLMFAPSARAVEYVDNSYGYGRLDYSNFLTAILNVELYVPKGKKPFPAIVELGPAASTGEIGANDLERLKRGYVVCRFSRKDADLIAGVYPGYECNQLEWWAYAASRCVDLLYARDDIDKLKIAAAGHSRGAKTALLAAIMDERIKAVINSHPGTGAGSFNLWRYAGDKYGGETLENSTRRFPYWNHPRMRFFMGRENKLPFDGHSLLALIAPRPCLMGSGGHDAVGEVWGDQQCYMEVKKIYRLLGHEENLWFLCLAGGT